jgi:hypothetical protein
MNHKITQIFPVSALSTSGATTAVPEKGLAAFSPDLGTNLGGTPSAPAEFKLVFGSGSAKYGTFKSSTIKQSNIISVTSTTADLSVQQQITYIGYDEVSAATPSFSCDEEYAVTLKIDEYWSKGIYQPMIQESIRVKTACCDTCSGGCDNLDAEVYMDEIVTKINENPLLSKYVVAAKVGSGSDWGVKITGKVVDEFGNACVPDAVPYVFNLVRFKVAVHPGPYNTQDFDIEDGCAPWAITTTQEIKYPIGDKAAMAELERHFFGNNLPATHEARRYWNPIYNNDSDEFLYVPSFTAANGFDMYEITYLEDSPEGFEKKTRNVHSVIILCEDNGGAESSVETAVRLFINALTGKTFAAN